MEGQKNIADTWTASRRSTFLTSRPGSRGTGTRALYVGRVIHKIVKKDRWTQEKISNPLCKLSQVFDRNKGGQNSFSSKNDENKAKAIRWRIVHETRVDESKLEDLFREIFFLIIFTKLVATRTWTVRLSMEWTPRHPMARSPMARSWLEWCFSSQQETVCATPTNKITNGKIWYGKSSDFFSRHFAYRH